jgi:hypothetical protein
MTTLKHLLSASLLWAISTHTVLAQNTFIDGSITVLDTGDTATVWDLLGITYGLPATSTTVRTTQLDDLYSGYDTSIFKQPVSSANASAGALTTATSANSAFTMSRVINAIKHTLTISNLSLDLGQRTVYADITTEQGSFLHQAWLVPLDTSYGTTGSTGSPTLVLGADGYLHATGSLTKLTIAGTWNYPKKIAGGTLDIIDKGLNIAGVSQGAIYGVPYAEVAYDVRFAVPEPSTYALMAAGMACLGLTTRCGQRALN